MPTFSQKVRHRIVTLRNQKGLSQKNLAESLGVNREQVSRYEGGQTGISLELAEDIAAALGVEPVQLLFPGETPEPVKVEVKVPVATPMSPEIAIDVLEDAVKKLRHMEKAQSGCDLSHLGPDGERLLELLPKLDVNGVQAVIRTVEIQIKVAREAAEIRAANAAKSTKKQA